MKKRNGQNGKVKEDCVIDDTTGSAIIHIWDELIDQVQNNKSYTFKNLSVKNYSGNTMLGSTASTTFDEVQTELKQVKGPDLLENKDKKVTVKEFKFVDKLNIYFQCQMKSCNKKKNHTTSQQTSLPAHHVVQPKRQRHQRKLCLQDFVQMWMALKPGTLHSQMS